MTRLKIKFETNLKLRAVLSFLDINQDIKLICFSVFIFAFGDGLFTFLLPVYIRQLNASPIDVGMLYAVYYLSWGITVLLGGFLADRFDPKKIMILCSFLWIPVPLALAFATSWKQLWLPMILYGTFFEQPSICVYILKSAPKEKVMQAFGVWSAYAAIGYVFSPTLGGVITSMIGKQTTFFLASIFYGASIIPLFFIKKQPKANKEMKGMPSHFADRDSNSAKLIVLCCFFTLTMFFVFLILPLIPQFTNGVYHQSIVSLGVFGTATSIGWIFFSAVFGKIGDKFSKMTAVTTAIMITGFSFLVIALLNNFQILCTASFLYGAAPTITFLMPGVIGAAAPEHLIGRWTSISQASVTIAGLGAPILGGILYEISPYLTFSATISVLFSAAVIGLSNKL